MTLSQQIYEAARLADDSNLETGQLNRIADAVAVAVLREVEKRGATRQGAGVAARKLLREFQIGDPHD